MGARRLRRSGFSPHSRSSLADLAKRTKMTPAQYDDLKKAFGRVKGEGDLAPVERLLKDFERKNRAG